MNAVEVAVDHIRNFAEKEIALLQQQGVKREELATAESAAGDQYLESSTTIGVDAVLRIQAEIAAINRAIGSCRQKRLQAIQAKLDAEVEALRARAAGSRRQAEELTIRARPHLDALREIEGVDHVPQGMAQSASAASMSRLLDGQAAEMERSGIPRHGHIQIDSEIFSLDEIVMAVLEQAVDTPSASDVITWVEAQPKSSTFAGNPTTCRMSWDMTSGGITASSYIRTIPQPVVAAPQEEAPPANNRLRTPNQFFGHAAPPVPQETRG